MNNVKIVNFSSNLITTIICLILGVIIFSHPEYVSMTISYLVSAAFIGGGLWKIIKFSYQKGKDSTTSIKDCVVGIVLIALAIICFFFTSLIIDIIRFIVGAFILLMGINRIIKICKMANKNSSQFIAGLIVALLLIAFSCYIIFVPFSEDKSLGIVLIIYSVIEIINYIIMAGETEQINANPHIQEAEAHEKENEKLIETKEEPKKNKNAKKKGKKN